jgi:signal transduction histidine kinase
MESASAPASLTRPVVAVPWSTSDVEPDSSQLVVVILQEALSRTGATSAAVYRGDDASQGWVLAASIGPSSSLPPTWFPFGMGLMQACEDARDVVRCDDALTDPRIAYPSLARHVGRAILGAPVACDGRVIGLLFVNHTEAGHFAAEHEAVLRGFVREFAPLLVKTPEWERPSEAGELPLVAITRDVLGSERRQRRVAEELHAVAQRITAAQSLEDALAPVVLAVEKIFGAASASVYLTEENELLVNRRFTTRHTGQPHWDDHVRVRADGVTRTVLRTGQPVVVEDVWTDGRTRDVAKEDHASIAAIPLRHGQTIVGVLFVNWRERRIAQPSDLSLLETLGAYCAIAIENTRLREHEQAARAQAEAEHQQLQKFLATVAHDLRGPLTLVVAYAELLRHGTLEERLETTQRALPGIENAARRVQRLINDLMDLARIGAGRFEMSLSSVDLVEIVRQVAEHQQTTTDRHRLIAELPERLDGEWDPARLRQLLTGLISNAIQFSPDGGEVRVHVGCVDGEARISVADQGLGIAQENMSRLFLPFSRLDPEPTTKESGLGLYLAKAIAEAHHGRIWLESEVGRGSTFYVAVPLRPGGDRS